MKHNCSYEVAYPIILLISRKTVVLQGVHISIITKWVKLPSFSKHLSAVDNFSHRVHTRDKLFSKTFKDGELIKEDPVVV